MKTKIIIIFSVLLITIAATAVAYNLPNETVDMSKVFDQTETIIGDTVKMPSPPVLENPEPIFEICDNNIVLPTPVLTIDLTKENTGPIVLIDPETSIIVDDSITIPYQ